MIGPKTNTRLEIGINLKDHLGTDRLVEQPQGSMCRYIVSISSEDEVDADLVSWLHAAYDQST